MVRYLVEPKNSGSVKNNLFEAVMDELKKNPEKVIFPNTNKGDDPKVPSVDKN